MQLSKYVVETIHPEFGPVYFHTVTKKSARTTCSEKTLGKHFFLAGQERAAIESMILNKPIDKVMGLFICPTWECNLRCTHCMVKDRLVEKQTEKIDIPALVAFISRCKERYNLENVDVKFFGGEPLLVVQDCIDIAEALSEVCETTYSLYTNLALELTDKHLEFLSKADRVGVSIDGPEKEHNSQRLPLVGDWNPFQLTMTNLQKLVIAGMRDIIEVQACFRDEYNTPPIQKAFIKLAIQHGVQPGMIQFGTIAPSKCNPTPGPIFLEGLKEPAFNNMSCCKYRHTMINTDVSGNVFTDYYSYTIVGNIYEDPAVIEERREKLIRESAPALADPKCQQCPVVGFCWGGCSVVENTGYPLSKYCNPKREMLQTIIKETAAAGTLLRTKKNDHNPNSLS